MMEDPSAVIGREIKLALVGDARVGKTSWISHLSGEYYAPQYTPTIGHQCTQCWFTTNLGCAKFNVWELSGSHNTAQDKAKCIEDSDAAVIMVDIGDRASIEHVIYWYREIMSFRKNSNKAATLPVMVYSFKAYKQDDKHGIDPARISWPVEFGDTPFLYNPYLELPGSLSTEIESDECDRKPIGWILEQLTGENNVQFRIVYPPEKTHPPPPYDPEYQRAQAEFDMPLPDDDSDL